MIITYTSYVELYKKYPSKVPYIKAIPGDPVEVADSFKDLIKKEDILKIQEDKEILSEVCPNCLKICSRCVCEKLASQKARIEAAQKTEEEEEEEQEKKANEKKEVVVVVNQDKVEKLIEKKAELKKSSKSKIEQKAELESYRKQLDSEEATKEPLKIENVKILPKGKLRKDPSTGEFYTVEE